VRCGKVAQSLWGIEIFSYHRCLSSSSIKAVREGSIISGLSLTHTAVSASRQCPEGVPTLRLIARIDICIDEEKTSNIQSRGYANAEKLAYRVPQKATTSSCWMAAYFLNSLDVPPADSDSTWRTDHQTSVAHQWPSAADDDRWHPLGGHGKVNRNDVSKDRSRTLNAAFRLYSMGVVGFGARAFDTLVAAPN
jgi:hypothetical protein